MFELSLTAGLDRPLRVLAMGAHADDIELGCGATLLKLMTDHPDIELRWAVASSDDQRAAEARSCAEDFTKGLRTPAEIIVGSFEDGYLPYEGAEVKRWVHRLGDGFTADAVFTHTSQDLHQDHRFLSELALNAFRNQPIFGFEIPKYDGDLGAPNVFVPVDADLARRKCELAARHYVSQAGKPWFDEETFLGLMRLRGVESRAASGYAEGFYCRKLVITGGRSRSAA